MERKASLIGVSGGCFRCGYSTNLGALSFYDGNGQTLHIDTNVLANSNYEKLAEKLKDAQVLCRNCVEELQNPKALDSSLRWNDEKDCFVPRNDVVKKFTENLAHSGIKQGQTIVLGVSGGLDSVTMLDLFAKADLNLKITVAHMNHGVREEAIHDEELVAKLTKKYGFRFISKTLIPRENHSNILKNIRMVGNLEEYLRNKRREFLLSAANDNKADFVALAHNADDQAETFIMNAVRGSGPAGLGAMSVKDEPIVRPMLNSSRREIETYARENKLVWNEDATNKDISYNRNYVRHRILPLLSRLNPEYLGGIGRTTGLQRQIDAHLKEEAFYVIARSAKDPELDSRLRGNDGEFVISAEKLRRLDKPLLYEVLGLMYEEVKGDRQNLSLAHLAAIEGLIQTSDGTKTLDLPGEVVAGRRYDKLDFCAKKEHNTPPTPSTKKLKIGTYKFGSWEVTVSQAVIPAKAGIQKQKGLDSWLATRNDTLIIDAEMLPNLLLRTRKPGDKIASLGTNGTKKLQDLFVDAKIDRVKRTVWPIVQETRTDQIIWVPGLAKAKIQLKTKKLLKINIVEVEHETTKEK